MASATSWTHKNDDYHGSNKGPYHSSTDGQPAAGRRGTAKVSTVHFIQNDCTVRERVCAGPYNNSCPSSLVTPYWSEAAASPMITGRSGGTVVKKKKKPVVMGGNGQHSYWSGDWWLLTPAKEEEDVPPL